MMVTVNAKIAMFLLQHAVTPFQVFFNLYLAIFAILTAVTPDKTSKSHPPIRMYLLKKESVEREIQHFAQKTVTAIGLGNAIAVSHKNAFALNFKNYGLVNLHAKLLREKISIGKIMVALQKMHLDSRLHELGKGAVQIEMR